MTTKNKKPKAVIAISGGVDSAVAAFLLKDKYELIGVYMKLVDNHDENESAARHICRDLNIKFYPVNLKQKFNDSIIEYFLDTYKKGETPNPCVKCNKKIKFGQLLKITKELGADFLITGHYIKKTETKGTYKLFRGTDTAKDQTYFLYNLTQDQLKHILFPLGDYQKEEIKQIAQDNKLNHQKSESQDICFLNKNGKILDHNDFLKDHIKMHPGPIKTLDEKELGIHQGLQLYTIGQRRGVEIGGIGPFYVARMDYNTNTLYVTNNPKDKALCRQSFTADNINWISNKTPKYPFKCEAVIRYRHTPIPCTITQSDNKTTVTLDTPQRAVTNGQSVVFYKQNELLGGGIIQ